MKKDIHPKYYPKAKVKCNSCQTVFEIGSTREYMEVDVCSHCHPFYTGKERIIDTLGEVEKYQKRLKKTEEIKKKRAK